MSQSSNILQPVTENLQTVQKLVLDRLRQAIVSGQLKPGEKLTVRDLAAELGVSTMPVRQALSTLAAEGYIQHTPHRSFEVAPANADEAETIYLIRVRLEPLAAELVASHHTDGDLETLHDLASNIDTAIENNDFEHFLRSDWAFHDALYNACRRPRLIKLIQEVRQSALRYRHLYNIGHQTLEEMRHTQSEHRTLLQAIYGHDPHIAGQMIAAGLHRWIKGLLEVLSSE